MMMTDNSLQDDHAVAAAKVIVYKECLPDHIKRVFFSSDGAGNYKSKLHQAYQPFCLHWTGVEEVSLRITPAGDGKSVLDGMFGRLNVILKQAVDAGAAYSNASTILDAIERTDGLTATSFREYGPDRSCKGEVEILGIDDFGSVLTTILLPTNDGSSSFGTTLAFRHSDYGEGIQIDPQKMIKFKLTMEDGTEEKVFPYKDDVSDYCLHITNPPILPYILIVFYHLFL